MPVILREVSVAAGVTNNNLLSGSPYELARGNVLFSIGVSAAATGTFCQITSGADLVAEEFAPPVLTRYPIIPDEMYFSDFATIVDRLAISARNPTGGAVIHRAAVQITGVG
jgi:hypothetical protein